MRIVWKLSMPLLLLTLAAGCGGARSLNTPIAPDPPGSYSTKFPLSENPMSDGSKWVNGGVVGLDWTNVSTTSGRAIGHEVGANFTDATAVLQTLSWGPDQKATAVVSTTGVPLDSCFQEVELRLRTVVSAHNITGYEVNYKFSTNSTGYMQIVRWNGAVGNFTTLQPYYGQQFGVTNGDTVTATVVGNVITAYKNGVQQGQATDNTYSGGSPGIGFNLENDVSSCPGTNANYGFSAFTAVDSTQGSF
jgi:hypothetical protein